MRWRFGWWVVGGCGLAAVSWQCGFVARGHQDGRAWDDGNVLPQELPVAERDTTRAIHAYDVLVELAHLDDHACFVPFGWVGSSLVLNAYAVTYSQWWEGASVFGQAFGCTHMSISERFLTGHECLPPSGVGLVPPWVDGDEVSNGASKNAHGGGEAGVPVRGISILEHCSLKFIGVQ